MTDLLEKLLDRRDLDNDEAGGLFGSILAGEADPAQVAGLLVALQAKGVTPGELAAAAGAMRRHAVAIDLGDLGGAVDTCGTGGTGSGAFNVSTAAAILAAACGVRAVKHGNRAASSKTGSADVLEALGVNLDADPRRCLDASGVAFLFARNHHPAMRHVAPVRKSLGVPTVFNLLGPLTNPAGVKRQLIGVARPGHTELLAETLRRLSSSERAWIICAADGQDDLSCGTTTRVSELADDDVTTWTFDPSGLGLSGTVADLRADSPAESAAIIRRVFDSRDEGPCRDAVLLNAAAAVVVAGGGGIGRRRPGGRPPPPSTAGRAAGTLDALVAASRAA